MAAQMHFAAILILMELMLMVLVSLVVILVNMYGPMQLDYKRTFLPQWLTMLVRVKLAVKEQFHLLLVATIFVSLVVLVILM